MRTSIKISAFSVMSSYPTETQSLILYNLFTKSLVVWRKFSLDFPTKAGILVEATMSLGSMRLVASNLNVFQDSSIGKGLQKSRVPGWHLSVSRAMMLSKFLVTKIFFKILTQIMDQMNKASKTTQIVQNTILLKRKTTELQVLIKQGVTSYTITDVFGKKRQYMSFSNMNIA